MATVISKRPLPAPETTAVTTANQRKNDVGNAPLRSAAVTKSREQTVKKYRKSNPYGGEEERRRRTKERLLPVTGDTAPPLPVTGDITPPLTKRSKQYGDGDMDVDLQPLMFVTPPSKPEEHSDRHDDGGDEDSRQAFKDQHTTDEVSVDADTAADHSTTATRQAKTWPWNKDWTYHGTFTPSGWSSKIGLVVVGTSNKVRMLIPASHFAVVAPQSEKEDVAKADMRLALQVDTFRTLTDMAKKHILIEKIEILHMAKYEGASEEKIDSTRRLVWSRVTWQDLSEHEACAWKSQWTDFAGAAFEACLFEWEDKHLVDPQTRAITKFERRINRRLRDSETRRLYLRLLWRSWRKWSYQSLTTNARKLETSPSADHTRRTSVARSKSDLNPNTETRNVEDQCGRVKHEVVA